MKRDPNRKYKVAAIVISILMVIGLILPYIFSAFR